MDHNSRVKESVDRQNEAIVKINNLKRVINRHLVGVREQREKYPDGQPYIISDKELNQLYDMFDALCEEGERIDFNVFNKAMEKIDELLKKLRMPVQFRRADILNDINEILLNLEQSVLNRSKK